MSLTPGRRLGQYEILALVGAGGMGEVYAARDARLDRKVALKVLPAGASTNTERRRRFEREARAASALNHPNICTIHETGSIEGVDYICFEYVEGVTLSALVAKSGGLPLERLLDIALPLSEALDYAHRNEIIHRDIKPSNLMVSTLGVPKILDFGLAKRESSSAADEEMTKGPPTRPGVLLGTLPYMSPEQALMRPLDARSDVFSFGCVLYQMAAGRPPFSAASDPELLDTILHGEPIPLARIRPDLPPELERIVEKALRKDPSERYQHMSDLVADLRHLRRESSLRTAAGSTDGLQARMSSTRREHRRRWVRRALLGALPLVVVGVIGAVWMGSRQSVLSFAPRDWILVADLDNLTPDPVFDRSLVMALTVSLEQSTHANVFPRARVAGALTRMKRDLASRIDAELGREICRRENIRALVSSSIARVGPRYALSARIVDPSTGESIRSYVEQADGADGVLPALSSLARDIRRGLGESLQSIEQRNRALPQVTTPSLPALQLYADGQRSWSKGQHSEGVKLYEAALQLDPEFAMAYAALGNAYSSFIFNQPVKGRGYFDKALQLSARTTERERLTIEATAAASAGNIREAERAYGAYLTTYPDDTVIRYSFGTMLMRNNRQAEALEQFMDVIRASPQDARALINAATSYVGLNQYPKALEYYRMAFELEPAWELGGNLNHEYGFVLVKSGDASKAREVFSKAVNSQDSKAGGLRSLALLEMYEGRYRDAEIKLREAVVLNRAAQAPLSEARNLMFLAQVREGRGAKADALAELDRAATLLAPLDTDVGWYATLGSLLARAGAASKARRQLAVVARRADAASPSEMSDLHRLEGEIALAEKQHGKAIDSFALADREVRSGLTLEGLANAYLVAGRSAEAIATYEALLALDGLGSEVEHPWLAAHYTLTDACRRNNQADRARHAVDMLLQFWKDADPDLPVVVQTRELRRRLDR